MANEQSFLTQVVAQTVTQSNSASGVESGNRVRAVSLTAQAITTGTAGALRTSQVVAQTITQSTPTGVRVAQYIAQVLVQNLASSGGHFRNSSNTAQVIYTIGVEDTPRQRAWTFDFDGHTFYVLDLGANGAIAYDLTTQSWSHWDTQGYEGHFNMKNGFHWRDGKQVLGGGLNDGMIVAFNEDGSLDEGFRPVAYEVNGVIFSSSESYVRQYNLRLVGAAGRRSLDDDVDPPTLAMVYSDDGGDTWSDEDTVELTSDTKQRIEFRSLGAFRQPGRIFRLYDNGGIKFLAYVMADVDGE